MCSSDLYDGSTYLGNATVTGASWSYTDSRTLTNGQSVSYTARVSDTAGNQSAAGTAYTATVDTSASAPTLGLATDSGSSSSDKITNVGTVNVTGLESGATWQYSLDSGTTWQSGTGSSFTLSGDGSKNVIVRQTDVAGNQSANSATFSFTLDTAAPSTTAAVTSITDNVGIVQGTVTSGGVTDDTSLVIGGTLSANLSAGETVRIYDGSTYLGKDRKSTRLNSSH